MATEYISELEETTIIPNSKEKPMNTPYVNQFPTVAPSYVLLTLGPTDDEYEYLQQVGKPMLTFEEVKRRLLNDGEPVHISISCSESSYDVLFGELRFSPDTDEYCPVTITFSSNEYIKVPQYFDIVIDPNNQQENGGISIHEDPLTKDLMLYIPLIFN